MVESGIVRAERRTHPRVAAFVAVELSTASKPRRCGITRDASENGLLIVTPSRFVAGDGIEVCVHLGRGDEQAHATGRVVRVDENPKSSAELFRYRLAVTLEEPLPAHVLARCNELAVSAGVVKPAHRA